MANRSYLYSYHPGKNPAYRGVAEWNYGLPIAHLLLVGSNPTPCQSAIWQVDGQVAIRGEAAASRLVFLKFIDWLAPQFAPSDFDEYAAEARDLLARADRQGSHYHLEPVEIYQLEGLDPEAMVAETVEVAALAGDLFVEARAVIDSPGTAVGDLRHEMFEDLEDMWEEDLGLDFSEVLFFDPNS